MKAAHVVLLSALTAAITAFAVVRLTPPPRPTAAAAATSTVPALTGLSEADAKTNLEAAGLVLMVAGRVATADAEEGTVTQQEPAAGTAVPRGGVVKVTFALPVPQIPSVVGKPLAQAQDELRRAGYTVEVGKPIESEEPAGTVVVQHPGAGTALASEGKVSLSPSKGLSEVEVPKLTGMTASQAREAGEKAGLTVEEKIVALPETPLGVVLRQTPPAGAMIAPGETVDVVVNR